MALACLRFSGLFFYSFMTRVCFFPFTAEVCAQVLQLEALHPFTRIANISISRGACFPIFSAHPASSRIQYQYLVRPLCKEGLSLACFAQEVKLKVSG